MSVKCQISRSKYKRRNKKDLRRCLKTHGDGAVVASDKSLCPKLAEAFTKPPPSQHQETTSSESDQPLPFIMHSFRSIPLLFPTPFAPPHPKTRKSIRRAQVPPPRQSYSPGGVTIFTTSAVRLCPL